MKTITHPQVRSEVIARLRKLEPNTPRKWGKMNAHQMVCHLKDSHSVVMGEMKAADKSNPVSRTVVRLIALRVPMQWPKGVATVPELDQAAGGGTRPVVFENDRLCLIELIDRFSAPRRDFTFDRHPIFGTMSDWEWSRWGYLHTDHHLRQFGL